MYKLSSLRVFNDHSSLLPGGSSHDSIIPEKGIWSLLTGVHGQLVYENVYVPVTS